MPSRRYPNCPKADSGGARDRPSVQAPVAVAVRNQTLMPAAADGTVMRLHRDCRNFEEDRAHVSLHAGPDGVRSAPMGRCALSLMGLEGCPAACPHHRTA